MNDDYKEPNSSEWEQAREILWEENRLRLVAAKRKSASLEAELIHERNLLHAYLTDAERELRIEKQNNH